MLHIVLVEPQIPPNTGNISRLCAAMGLPLHLVKPLGFSTDDRELKRAGLDYWKHVSLFYHESFEELRAAFPKNRFFFFSTKVKRPYTAAAFREGDFLVFGNETKGLPEPLLQAHADFALTIPMTGPVRSLNLSSSVAMVTGEALRQLGEKT